MSASSFILQPVLYFGDDAVFEWEWVEVDAGAPDLRVRVTVRGEHARFCTLVFSATAARRSWRDVVRDR